MKSKAIIINSCKECPYRADNGFGLIWDGGYVQKSYPAVTYKCGRTQTALEIEKEYGVTERTFKGRFPKDCPLYDVEIKLKLELENK